MKKIISMGIASAVLALTAIAASADIVASTTDKAEAGKTVTVVVTSTAPVEAFGFNIAAEGLAATEANVVAGGPMVVTEPQADGSLNITGISLDAWKAGDALATITYTVTAETGDVAVALKGMPGMDDVYTGFTLTVTTDEPGTSEPGTSEPGTSEPGTSEPGTTDPTDPGNAETGVALAVVPAVLAGAAVVVAKKRK